MNDSYGVFGEQELTVAGLPVDQEIRAEALAAASRVMTTAASPDGRRTLKLAQQFEAWIRDGSLPDSPPPITVA